MATFCVPLFSKVSLARNTVSPFGTVTCIGEIDSCGEMRASKPFLNEPSAPLFVVYTAIGNCVFGKTVVRRELATKPEVVGETAATTGVTCCGVPETTLSVIGFAAVPTLAKTSADWAP